MGGHFVPPPENVASIDLAAISVDFDEPRLFFLGSHAFEGIAADRSLNRLHIHLSAQKVQAARHGTFKVLAHIFESQNQQVAGLRKRGVDPALDVAGPGPPMGQLPFEEWTDVIIQLGVPGMNAAEGGLPNQA